jgi:hypothetical protein
VQRARAVFAKVAVPAVTIARYPSVEMLRDKVNSGNQQKPGNELPSGQCKANACPGVRSGINTSGGVDGLHQAHRFVDIDLWKARGDAGIVKVQEFDEAVCVHAPNARHAGAAQIARSVVKYGQLGHSIPHGRNGLAVLQAARRWIAQQPEPTAVDFILASNERGPRCCGYQLECPERSEGLGYRQAEARFPDGL